MVSGSSGTPLTVVEDVNGDGRPDLIEVTTDPNQNQSNVGVQLNLGSGVFGAPIIFPISKDAQSVAEGDLNNDGQPDMAIGYKNNGGVSILLGTLQGGFGAETKYAPGKNCTGLAIGDLNEDGLADVVVVASNSGAFMLLQQSNGLFTGPNMIPNVGGGLVALADFNTDQHLDLALSYGSVIYIYHGDGQANFSGPTNYTIGGPPDLMVVSRINEDAAPDVVFGDTSTSLLLADGVGGFAPPVSLYPFKHQSNGVNGLATADLNGDGLMDVARTEYGSNLTIQVLLNAGSGNFNAPALYEIGQYCNSLVLADVNGDGVPDAICGINLVGTGSNHVTIAFGDGVGGFVTGKYYKAGNSPTSIAIADFNNDGKPDLSVTNAYSNDLSILLGESNGAFGLPTGAFPVGIKPWWIAAGDLNGDGIPRI
ncbi:MAG: VCBS repeat-containing protein [Planctomycetes bacterium]|nr:VCBS repeat-containing protein [Planctomycetota bacterium]